MSNITVKMKDGTIKKFMHEGRAGGSYTKRLFYEGSFAIIEDEYNKKTAIPASDISEIIDEPDRHW